MQVTNLLIHPVIDRFRCSNTATVPLHYSTKQFAKFFHTAAAMHVFTYGTLMFPEIWKAVAGRDVASIQGTAAGYEVYRVRNAVFPGIVKAAEQHAVRGVVYFDVDAQSLARLDRFEDDFYRREALWVSCDDGEWREAQAYVVPPDDREVLTDELWRADEFIARGGLQEFIRRFHGFARIGDAG